MCPYNSLGTIYINTVYLLRVSPLDVVENAGQVTDRALVEPHGPAVHLAILHLLGPSASFFLIHFKPSTKFFILNRFLCKFLTQLITPAE